MKYRTIYLNRKSVFFGDEVALPIWNNIHPYFIYSKLALRAEVWAQRKPNSKQRKRWVFVVVMSGTVYCEQVCYARNPPHLEQYSFILHIFEISFASRGMSVVHWEISSCCWGRNPNLPFETVYSLLTIHHSLIHTDKFFSLLTKINNSQQ